MNKPEIEKNIGTCLNYFKGNFLSIEFMATKFKKYNKDVLDSDFTYIYIYIYVYNLHFKFLQPRGLCSLCLLLITFKITKARKKTTLL